MKGCCSIAGSTANNLQALLAARLTRCAKSGLQDKAIKDTASRAKKPSPSAAAGTARRQSSLKPADVAAMPSIVAPQSGVNNVAAVLSMTPARQPPRQSSLQRVRAPVS